MWAKRSRRAEALRDSAGEDAGGATDTPWEVRPWPVSCDACQKVALRGGPVSRLIKHFLNHALVYGLVGKERHGFPLAHCRALP